MLPEVKVTYALQSSLDRAIDQYEINLKKNINLKKDDQKKWGNFKNAERGKIMVVAQLQQRLVEYRLSIDSMDIEQCESESHDSSRLGDFMRVEGMPKPNYYYHAHAIISGCDTRAWILRTALAESKIGVDDPHNGCWLPASSRHCGQKPYPNAVPHSRIHRENYYLWLNIRFFNIDSTKIMIDRLNDTRRDLLHSTFPPEVMLKKGEWKEPRDNL